MSSEFNKLLDEIKRIDKTFKVLNYKVNVLYKTQWAEKVSNGYERWRVDPCGGKELVKLQLEKLGYICPVCNDSLSEELATIDHLLPKSKFLGLAMVKSNMLVMCQSCNSAKNNQEFEQWYSNLSSERKKAFCDAMKKVHGKQQLIELLVGK